MAATITIDGIDKTAVFQAGYLDVDKRFASEMATLRVLDLDSTAGAYRPSPDQALRGLHNADLLLGGPIVRVTDRRAVDDVATVTVIEARDWTVLADRVFVSLQTFASQGALLLFDTLVDTYLADLGVTNISAGFTGGPALPALIVDNPTTTLRQVLDQITAQCGWPWRINGDQQAALVEPGTLPGPVTLDESNVLDGWTWQKETILNANRVFLQTEVPEAGAGPWEHFETRTGDGVRTVFPVNVLPSVIRGSIVGDTADSATSLAMQGLPLTAPIRIGAQFTVDGHSLLYTVTATVTTNGAGEVTLVADPGLQKAVKAGVSVEFKPSAFVQLELNGVVTPMAGAPWVWDEQESAMVNPSSAPAVGVEVVYRTWVTLGTWVRVWETASPNVQLAIGWFDRSLLVDGVIDANGHTDLAAAAAYGRDVLTRKLAAPKRVTLRTHTPGWYPLLTATLSLGNRLVSGEYLVEAVRVRDVGIDPATSSEELVYELELIEGDDIRSGNAWIDYFRGLNPQGGIKWGVIPPIETFEWTTNRQYSAPSAADGVSITPNASAWANSAYAEVTASTASAWLLTGVCLEVAGTNAGAFELDIAVGAAASEVVVATVKGYVNSTTNAEMGYMPLPIPIDAIPASSRVSMRLRKPGTNTTAWVCSLTYLVSPIVGDLTTTTKPSKVTTPGAALTLVPHGGSAWANGTYAEVIASAAADLVLVGYVFANPGVSQAQWEFDIAIGAAASEVVITTVRGYNGTFSVGAPCYCAFPSPLSAIPSGSRVSIRYRATAGFVSNASIGLIYHEAPL